MTFLPLILILYAALMAGHQRTSIHSYKISGNTIVFDDSLPSGNRYHILLRAKKFNEKKHKVTWQTETGTPKPILIVTKIDGHEFYGTDGELPTEEIDTFAVEINGKSILIPKSDYSDLFQPSIWYSNERDAYGSGVNPYETSDGKLLKIVLDFSDGAGYYRAVFKFNHEKFLRRQIESGM
ncbi:MAG TPA: hypothetical protein VFD13_06510 [Candidatus Kapabacteria bacterium]|nr:hypothetical protein [Candidatus Kapabacteria bacterium]